MDKVQKYGEENYLYSFPCKNNFYPLLLLGMEPTKVDVLLHQPAAELSEIYPMHPYMMGLLVITVFPIMAAGSITGFKGLLPIMQYSTFIPFAFDMLSFHVAQRFWL